MHMRTRAALAARQHAPLRACSGGEPSPTCRARRMCSRVCGMGPSVADTTRIAPSICAAAKADAPHACRHAHHELG